MEKTGPYERIFESTLLTQPDELYDAADYITTATGNKVSRSSKLKGQQHLHLHGKVCCVLPRAAYPLHAPALDLPAQTPPPSS